MACNKSVGSFRRVPPNANPIETTAVVGFNATFKTADYLWVARHEEVKGILTVRDTPDKYVDSWLAAAPFIDIVKRAPYCWIKTLESLLPSLEQEYMV